MAIAGTLVVTNPNINMKIFNITALDADTGPTNIPHGFAVTPAFAFMMPLISAAAYPGWAVSLTAANLVVSKLNAAGSGGGVPGTTVVLIVMVVTPTSLFQ